MITHGDMVMFEHVFNNFTSDMVRDGHALIGVVFDGEWDLWCTQAVHPTVEQKRQALAEVEQYYMKDWEGTNRTIPVFLFPDAEHMDIVTDAAAAMHRTGQDIEAKWWSECQSAKAKQAVSEVSGIELNRLTWRESNLGRGWHYNSGHWTYLYMAVKPGCKLLSKHFVKRGESCGLEVYKWVGAV